MANIVRKVGHIIKHGPEIIRKKIIFTKLQHQDTFKNSVVKQNREPQLIVSLTSYKERFSTLDICLKSLLNQTLLPDHLILYLNKEEKEDVPVSIKKLEQYGLEIEFVDRDLKPHKKYYYAMKEYPNDIVITVDDDVIYSKYLIESLYKTYKKFPNCVVAARAHEIVFKNKKIKNYLDWNWSSNISNKPSFLFMGTGVGGILYPPHLLNLNLLLNLNYIKKYINVDDLWLKTVEIMSNIPVVICDAKIDRERIDIPYVQGVGLAQQNVNGSGNNANLKSLDDEFGLALKIKKAEEKLRLL